MNRFDNESRRTAEARNGNGGELGAAARELSKIAVEETKRTTGLSQRAAYRKRLFEMRRGLNGEYRRNYALAAGSVFCGAVGEVLVNEYYRVEKQLRIAAAEAESLKFGRLPCFAAGEAAGSLRCAVLAKKLCELCGGAPGIGSVVEFFDEYQQNKPLTTREIQLLPAMLRRAELETLYGIVCTSGDGPLGTGRAAALQNVLAALSRIDDADFSECIQNLNITRRRLADAADFSASDESTQQLYLKAAAEISERTSASEQTVVRKAFELSKGRTGRRALVGCSLLAEGKPELIRALRAEKKRLKGIKTDNGAKAPSDSGKRTDVQKHKCVKLSNSAKCALLTVFEALLAAALLVPAAAAAGRLGSAFFPANTRVSAWFTVLTVIFGLMPALSAAFAIEARLMPVFKKPRPLPRLSLRGGIGEKNRTLVAVPVLITSEKSVRQAAETLEAHYLAAQDFAAANCGAEFAILADFPDSAEKTKPGEAELIELAKKLTDDLNSRFCAGGRPVFHYLHRERVFNSADGVYMGRERKRGAVEALLDCAAHGDTHEFCCNYPDICSEKERFRFLVVLDADTIMPNGALRRLIGAAAHPLNLPVFENGAARPSFGFSIIAPRMAATSRSAAESGFAALISGESGMCAYSVRVSDFNWDVFEEGNFGGKGIINIDAFLRSVSGKIPENTVLSHDLAEGCFARAAYAADIVLYDGEPSALLPWQKRRHRWLRGDMQLLPFLFPPLNSGIDAVSRRKILFNIRAAFGGISFAAAFLLAAVLGLRPLFLLAATTFFIDLLLEAAFLLLRLPFRKSALRPLVLLAGRRLYELAVLPYSALRDADAVCRALYRMIFSHRNMLQWQTAADAERSGPQNTREYFKALFPCAAFGTIVLAAAVSAAIAAARQIHSGETAGMAAAGLATAVLWLCAPLIAEKKDKKPDSYRFTAAERGRLTEIFADTWQYFEQNCTEKTSWLPPDNFQEEPYRGAAMLTSPTNIGMGLMAVVSAHDMHLLDERGMFVRLERMVDSIEKLEKWHGHPFNWYNLRDLSLLRPRFISTVDSGNLFACLITTACALAECAGQAEKTSAEFAEELSKLAARCTAIARAMDFRVLYDNTRELFHIGCSFEEGKLTPSHYDLLASECRLTSFSAIAFSRIGSEHWFALSRLMCDASGGRVLKSWSGTMFEYLMPLIFFETVPYSMQFEVCRNAVLTQILAAAAEKPWGVSESGYYAFDDALRYQYRAFGNPELALAPGRMRSDVIAPYACVLALAVEPKAAAENLRLLCQIGAAGKYGLYEALDYGAAEKTGFAIVKSYMAHHQGMSLCAINNALNNNVLARRFMSVPEVRANEQLLFENMPVDPIRIKTYESEIFREPHAARNADEFVRIIKKKAAEAKPNEAPRLRGVFIRKKIKNPGNRKNAIEMQPTEGRTENNSGQAVNGQIITNGSYSVFVDENGCGYSKCGGVLITRLRGKAWGAFGEDAANASEFGFVPPNGGDFVIAKYDSESGEKIAKRISGSITAEPHRVVSEDRFASIRARLTSMVAADSDCEIRTLELINCGKEEETVDVGMFAEIALAPAREFEAHPAFVRVCTESERADDTLIFTMRKKPGKPSYSAFFNVASLERVQFCADGLVCPGRHKSHEDALLMQCISAADAEELPTVQPVEPYFFAKTKVRLGSGESGTVRLTIGFTKNKTRIDEILHRQRQRLQSAEAAARMHSAGILRAFEIDAKTNAFAQILNAFIVKGIVSKGKSDVKGQIGGIRGLWKHGISGDRPIVLMRVTRSEQMNEVRMLLNAAKYINMCNAGSCKTERDEFNEGSRTDERQEKLFDVVLIGEYPHEYANALRAALEELRTICPTCILLHGFELTESDRALIHAAAQIEIDADAPLAFADDSKYIFEHGSINEKMAETETMRPMLTQPNITDARKKACFSWNGCGGFDNEKMEFVIENSPKNITPLPWSNVLAGKRMGALVTESGGGYTWCGNARMLRITPWSNDALFDTSGEFLILFDIERESRLSLLPAFGSSCVVSHGFGYSRFEWRTAELRVQLTVTVDMELPLKYSTVCIENLTANRKKLRLRCGADWVLGEKAHPASLQFETVGGKGFPLCAAARDALSEHPEWGFLSILGGSKIFAANENQIAAEFTVEPQSTAKLTVLLGFEQFERIPKLIADADAEAALNETMRFYRQKTDMLRIKTGDASFDALVNGRLLYQTYSARIIGRTGFWQCGGAFGFRDQLQDAAALAATDPECTRNMIIKCASRQFKKGDVLHWWHEGFADGLPRGVRTMISDDRLFLPLAACEYAEVSGDAAIFDEQIPYLADMKIPYGQQNIYCEMERSDDTETLYEHCCRAVELSFELRGAHGLPLMGTGDWNDGMDAVGWDGGESVVVGWLLLLAARALLPVCKKRGDTARAILFERGSAALRAAIESNAWDKNRYIRAFFGDGTSLGSADCSECAVDCVSECFAVFANAVHAREAFETVLAALTDPVNGLIRLLTPPFDGKTRNAVGYIEGYLPGVRENGGQYTHAAAWCIIAACRLGMADTADSLFKMINPIEHGSANSIERYKGEPYAVAGDVYSVGRLAGRAGWTLYTGSAAWLYRAAVENILGIRKRGTKLFVEPCTVLDAFSFEYRFGNTVYSVDMHRSASNAKERHGACVELVDDGKVHNLSLEYR